MRGWFKPRRLLMIGLVLLQQACLVGAALAEIWSFSQDTTVVRFTYDHFGLSRQSGQFRGVTGHLQFDPTRPEKGRVFATIKMATLTTGVPKLDKLLKSADFFDVERYPTATFKSTGVRALIAGKTGQVSGDLTLMGITKPVAMTVRWNYTGVHPLASVNPSYAGKWVSGFSATFTIQRSAFGLKRGLPLLGERVRVEIEAEFARRG